MPVPIVGPLIEGGAALVGGFLNAFSQRNTNREAMAFQREMYKRQYADTVGLWNMQNAYNSPQAQMKRFQEAGLNPHLIYGQGNAGNAGAITPPSPGVPSLRAPEWGGALSAGPLAYLSAMYDLDIKQAQTDNLKAQNTVITQEALLKAAQIGQTTANTARSEFDLSFERDLRNVSAEARREALRQLTTSTDLSVQRNLREAVQLSSNLNEATARIEGIAEEILSKQAQRANTVAERDRILADTTRIKKQIRLMAKEGIIKDLDVKLAQDNIRPGDPLWYRTITQGFNSVWNYLFK